MLPLLSLPPLLPVLLLLPFTAAAVAGKTPTSTPLAHLSYITPLPLCRLKDTLEWRQRFSSSFLARRHFSHLVSSWCRCCFGQRFCGGRHR